jgi:alpha-L-fucosidase
MKTPLSLLAGLAFLAGPFLVAGQTASPAASTVPSPPPGPAAEPSAAEHDARMAWFRQAKFGLFIHWGLYAVPAGIWQGRPIPSLGEWIMHNAPIPLPQYEELAKQFNPVKFDAEAWVQLAADAGMKYIVITSKHHDGFAMYHSLVSPYNIYDATPFHRDPLKELAAACARHGIRFGFYYSQAQDWHEPNGAGNNNDFGPDDKKDFDQYLRGKAEPQVRELLSNYGPVCLIWFDTPRMMDVGGRGQRFVDLVHALQPATLIDGRLAPGTGDYASTGDNAIPSAEQKGDWETPATTNHTWGFKRDDTDWKSPGEILFKLVDIASKGGNYLLNVGPTAEGVIPQEVQDNLRTVGRWLQANGDAVYGAGRSPFGAEFGDEAAHLQDAAGKPVFLERAEWRCTAKPGRLYFTVFKPQREGLRLPAFQSPITRVYFLGDPAQAPLTVETVGGARIVRLPRLIPNPIANVVCVEYGGGLLQL